MTAAVQNYELFLSLMVLVVAVVLIANRLRLAPSIALVIAGLMVSLIPNLKPIPLDPALIFIIVLPPLLMEAAQGISIRDLRANLRPVILLAVGLVIATSGAVAAVMTHVFPGIPLAAAFVLGAIVSPPDAVAATSILRYVPIPRRVRSILEGESLVNDATALTIYKIALTAVVTGTFSIGEAAVHFTWMAVSGIFLGAVLGECFTRAVRLMRDSAVEVTSSFLLGYIAYISAELVHSSGVLATVAAGLVVSWRSPLRFTADYRIRAAAAWQILSFLLNGFVFILIGLQFPIILGNLSEYRWQDLVGVGLLISLVVILVRIAWIFAVAYLTRMLIPRIREHEPAASWKPLFLLGWTGLRGVITLAAALALPLTVSGNTPFPARDLIVFMAFAVIYVTLVGQGLGLPLLVKALNFAPDFNLLQEEWNARRTLTVKVLQSLEAVRETEIPKGVFQRLFSHYQDRMDLLGDGPNTPLDQGQFDGRAIPTIVRAEQTLWRDIIKVEREALNDMRHSQSIGDEVMHAIEEEIDLLHARFTRGQRA